MHRKRAGAAIVVAASAMTCLTACSDDPVDGRASRPAATALQQSLGRIAADRAAFEQVVFSRPSAVARLLPTRRPQRGFSPYFGLTIAGAGYLGAAVEQLDDEVDIDLAKARYAYSVGVAPDTGGAVEGVGTSTLQRTLESVATSVTTSGGSTTFRMRPDDEFRGNAKYERALPRLSSNGDLNLVRTTGDSAFRYAGSAADLRLVDPVGRTLLDSEPVAQVAACLGDPLWAMLTGRLRGYSARNPAPPTPPRRPQPSAGFRYLGIGVHEGRARPVEQLCVSADTAAHARTIAATVERTLATGRDLTGSRWSDDLTSSAVKVTGSTVSVSVTFDDGPADRLNRHYRNADLPGVYG